VANERTNGRPRLHAWRPVRDLAPDLIGYRQELAAHYSERWHKCRLALKRQRQGEGLWQAWFDQWKNRYALETGQIEGLYQIPRGMTETLIAEGFSGVLQSHSVTAAEQVNLKGILEDQKTAVDMMFLHVAERRPLTTGVLKEWHLLLTRNQISATGFDPLTGKARPMELLRGRYKARPNNPRIGDGIFEYCPPEQVAQQIEMFLEMNDRHKDLGLSPEMEAAWMHHEFVLMHPFQDGNGRMSRLLMSLPYIKANEFPPVIPSGAKQQYLEALDSADKGKLEKFAEYLGERAAQTLSEAITVAEKVLSGSETIVTANGGRIHRKCGYMRPNGVDDA